MMYRARQVIDLTGCVCCGPYVAVWPGVSRSRRTDGIVVLVYDQVPLFEEWSIRDGGVA